MAKKIIVKEQKHGCIWLCGVLLVVCLAVYALAFALIIALGVAVWFLMRGIWRSMVANKPDSKFVQFGMKMTPQTRKILAGIASAIVVIIISGIISAAMPQKEEKSPSGGEQAVATKTEKKDDESSSEARHEANQKRIDTFVNNFNAASTNPYVQDATFDPSDGDAPYHPRRYNSPVYAESKGSHGTSGDFELTLIACTGGELEISGRLTTDSNYQTVADMIKTIMYCEYPDADHTELDQKLNDFVNSDYHNFNYFNSSNLDSSYATGGEFFLRLDNLD